MEEGEWKWQVWEGAFAVMTGQPQPGDRWLDCEIISQQGKNDRLMIRCDRTTLDVPQHHLRQKKGDGVHTKYKYSIYEQLKLHFG